jgi:Ca2+/H+ antiporter, TMEM165/GDT1 family
MGSSATWGLLTATFTASFVECVEALTIVLAMGVTRSWRSALTGTALALVSLAGFTAVAGYALVSWLPRSALQLGIGTLLLIFGLQWLRKAILRSSGLKALHDEEDEFREQAEAARRAGDETRYGLDWFSFVVSFKGVFLEGVEVVFIVITFGLNAHDVPAAAGAAAAAAAAVVALGAVAHRPLARVPENTLKYVVGLLLSSFGTFWAVEGLGVFGSGGGSLSWPGDNWALLGVLAAWFVLSRVLIRLAPVLAHARRLPAIAEGVS